MRDGLHHGISLAARFLTSLAGDNPPSRAVALSRVVEGDETFILESFKGKRSGLPGKRRQIHQARDSAEQIPVIVARDRQGATTDRSCRN
jgi:hypothetical protein